MNKGALLLYLTRAVLMLSLARNGYSVLMQLFSLKQTGKNAFFVADLGKIVKKHIKWQNTMGPVKAYYTVKCNSSPAVLEIHSALGMGFVCANKVSTLTV